MSSRKGQRECACSLGHEPRTLTSARQGARRHRPNQDDRAASYRDRVALTYNISQRLIARYSAGPSAARTSAVKALHENIRSALENWGDKKFDTFLQGSYRNGTAIADINDVDIVALFDPWQTPATRADWLWLFNHVAAILRKSTLVSGSVRLGDKCVKLDGSVNADIVPAISPRPYSSVDPLMIYSRKGASERPNFPRTHYTNGVRKQAATQDGFKPTVRLFKRWLRQYPSLNAPSFYVECAVHSVATSNFHTYLPLSFASVATELLKYDRLTRIPSVAGDKDILVSTDWSPDDFNAFQRRLAPDVHIVVRAMQASTQSEADRLWKLAFGD